MAEPEDFIFFFYTSEYVKNQLDIDFFLKF